MSVAQGHEALEDDAPAPSAWAPPEVAPRAPAAGTAGSEPAVAEPGAAEMPALDRDEDEVPVSAGRSHPVARSHLPPLPPVPSSPAAWLRALRTRSLPLPLLGGAVGALLVARDPSTRPWLLALALTGLVLAHALAALLHALGDARPSRAGPLRRIEAGRAALGVATAGLCALFCLVALRGAAGLALAGVGAVALLLVLSRKSGTARTALAGVLTGAVAVSVTTWAATGGLEPRAALPGLAVGGVLAGLLVGRRCAVRGRTARVVVLAPYAAVGAAVALEALPWPVLAIVLALPAARRAARAAARSDAAPVVAGHARLLAGLLLAALAAAAVTGTDLPL